MFFSDTDVEALDFAWREFGALLSWEPCKVTHAYPEWRKRSGGPPARRTGTGGHYYAISFLTPTRRIHTCAVLAARSIRRGDPPVREKEMALEIAEERSAEQAFWDR